jgi:hypothetical protein
MFILDDEELDENKLSKKGKIALEQIQRTQLKNKELQIDISNLQIVENYYTDVLREEVKNLKEDTKD